LTDYSGYASLSNNAPGRFFKLNMNLVNYLKETRSELKHVSWPTRKQAAVFSGLVIGISLVTAAFLGFFDFIFTTLLKMIIA